MANKGILIIISGPAGVGKGTICKKLLQQDSNMCLSISETTRDPRPGERDGVDYFFISRETFLERIEKNLYLEYDHHFDRYYGTPADYVEQQLDQGKDVILEIDVNGAALVRSKVKHCVMIFILPPSLEELKKRILKRGTETEEQLKLREQRIEAEFQRASHFDYAVVNDDLDETVAIVRAIVTAEKHKPAYTQEKINYINGGK